MQNPKQPHHPHHPNLPQSRQPAACPMAQPQLADPRQPCHRQARRPASAPARRTARHHARAARLRYRGMAAKLATLLSACRTLRQKSSPMLTSLNRLRHKLPAKPCP